MADITETSKWIICRDRTWGSELTVIINQDTMKVHRMSFHFKRMLLKSHYRYYYDDMENPVKVVKVHRNKEKTIKKVYKAMRFEGHRPVYYEDCRGNMWKEEWGVQCPYETILDLVRKDIEFVFMRFGIQVSYGAIENNTVLKK